jgi:hypothetical protein
MPKLWLRIHISERENRKHGYQEEGCKENEKEIRKEGRHQDRQTMTR